MYNQIGNRHVRQSSMQFGGPNAATPGQERAVQYNVTAGAGKKLESFDAVAAGFNSATGGAPSIMALNDANRALGKNLAGHHSSTQCVRTQSQEYLRPAHHEDRSLQQNSTHEQGKQQAQRERAAVSIGAALSGKNGDMLGIYKTQAGQGAANLFEDLQRQAKLAPSRPQQIQLTNQRHAHVQKLLQ